MQESVYQQNAEAAGALGIERTRFVEHIHTGDVQMRPRGLVRQKGLQKAGGGNGAGAASVGDVFDVGHIRFEQGAVSVIHREVPQLFARLFARIFQQYGQGVVVAEQPRHFIAERDHNRTGQGRQVNNALGLVFLFHKGQAVAQNQAPLGIGVQNLHRLAGKRGNDVARSGCRAGGHILNQPDHADEIQFQFLLRGGFQRGGNNRGTGHVLFHIAHAGAGF